MKNQNNTLYNTRFIVLDTETTGSDTSNDTPIEVAAVEWIHGKASKLKTWYVNPGDIPLKPCASAVHHLTYADLAGALTLDEIKHEIIDFVKDSPLVIHNAPFDLAMLPFFAEHPTVDTLRLARHLWQKNELNEEGFPLKNHKIQTLRYWLDLDVDTHGLAAHRASADILVTGAVFQQAINAYLSTGLTDTPEALIEWHQKPIQYPSMPYGKYEGIPFSELPDKFINYYLNPLHNPNPDKDIHIILQEEKCNRILQQDSIRKTLPSRNF